MRYKILNDINDNSQDELFTILLDEAKNTYLSLVFPYHPEVVDLPNSRAEAWCTKCAIELYHLGDKGNLISYSENGLTESYEKSGLSKDLLSQLPPSHGRTIFDNTIETTTEDTTEDTTDDNTDNNTDDGGNG